MRRPRQAAPRMRAARRGGRRVRRHRSAGNGARCQGCGIAWRLPLWAAGATRAGLLARAAVVQVAVEFGPVCNQAVTRPASRACLRVRSWYRAGEVGVAVVVLPISVACPQVHAGDRVEGLQPAQDRKQRRLQLAPRLHVGEGLALERHLTAPKVADVFDGAFGERQHAPERLGLRIGELERGLLGEPKPDPPRCRLAEPAQHARGLRQRYSRSVGKLEARLLTPSRPVALAHVVQRVLRLAASGECGADALLGLAAPVPVHALTSAKVGADVQAARAPLGRDGAVARSARAEECCVACRVPPAQ
eukprot:scaffold34503_cov129-Isochrysis_galbana.AAC.2